MPLESLFGVGTITPQDVVKASEVAGETPFYLYDGPFIVQRTNEIFSMPHAFGLFPRLAMKANSNRALLQLVTSLGFDIDASSMNEVKRAVDARVHPLEILLTTQEVPEGQDRQDLYDYMLEGLKYNVCSMRQLELVSDFASEKSIPLSLRIHPGTGGSGESITRDTASPYSCFGVHITDLKRAITYARKKGVVFDAVHNHIGSGGSPEKWRKSVDRLLEIVEEHLYHFPWLKTVNFGGGLKQGRMPDEESADLSYLGQYAKKRLEEFAERTGKEFVMEIEPGTYIMAMAGNAVTRVIDKKSTGRDGFNFLVLDGGMEINARPLFYGSRHPFAVVSASGKLLSSEYDLSGVPKDSLWVPVGRCCESGDSQSLDAGGNIVPRRIAETRIGEYFVVGGTGAYCSSMTPFNYNSHTQAPEVLKRSSGKLQLIRKPQSLKQVTQNELDLD